MARNQKMVDTINSMASAASELLAMNHSTDVTGSAKQLMKKRAESEDRRKHSKSSIARKANRTSNFGSSSVEIMKDDTKSESMEIAALRSKVINLES